MIRTQIQLEEHQIQWLRTEAKARGVSVSQLIREGVEILCTQKKHASGNKAKRALAAIGRFSLPTEAAITNMPPVCFFGVFSSDEERPRGEQDNADGRR